MGLSVGLDLLVIPSFGLRGAGFVLVVTYLLVPYCVGTFSREARSPFVSDTLLLSEILLLAQSKM